ncbi:MAG: MauE/DoxX family redox-associated membrane protein [Desulfococcaceae bacterium]
MSQTGESTARTDERSDERFDERTDGRTDPTQRRFRWEPTVHHVLRLFMGGVFLYASYDKILKPAAFAEAVYNYQILPDAAVNLAALTLPWLEFLLGACLIAGVWMPGATAISTGLMLVFVASLVYNQMRGLDIHCGCFSTEITEGPADAWTVVRDLIFLAASAYLTVRVFWLRPETTTKPDISPNH